MVLAIPITGNTLTPRLGQCESYLFISVDSKNKKILNSHTAVAPPHAPDHLSDWIVKQGADTLIASTIPNNFRSLMEFHGLKVIEHTGQALPLELAQAFLDGTLTSESGS